MAPRPRWLDERRRCSAPLLALSVRRARLLRAAAKDINLMSGGSAHVCAAALAVRGQPVIGTLCAGFKFNLARLTRTPGLVRRASFLRAVP